MSRKNTKISFCVPVHNEGEYIINKIKKLELGLRTKLGKNNFEIIIVENGSKDDTPNHVRKLSNSHIRGFSIQEKGVGAAFRKAITEAKFNHVLLSAIDIPFGFSDLDGMLEIFKDYDLIYGSKAHRDSIVETNLKRHLASYVYQLLLRIILSTPVKDTQGSVFLNKKSISPLLNKCDADNAFFSTQIAIYAHRSGLKITEIPVKMKKSDGRKSKYSVVRDGSRMFAQMLNEYIKVRNYK